MGGWFYILKEIVMSEAGGMAGEAPRRSKRPSSKAVAHCMNMRE